jgi:sigma-B regulation protein RsbU (phosphoserine phosphatase)
MKQDVVANPEQDDSAPAKGSILIVDDTPANLQLLARMLADRGYQVRPVLDGQLALASVEAEPPDLILLDIRMPEMNGYQVCERLKANPSTSQIPVIFLSAMDALEDKVKAFRAGGVDYVTKPFQIEEVTARVETHLTLSRLREQLQRANAQMAAELQLAGEVQRSFLPHDLPELDSWQVAVRLESARETSGDFYDMYPLQGDRLGILVADVVDKGVGAALFMALSWAIMRTYAGKYPRQPERMLGAANTRLLRDTTGKQFATVFYGILDPSSGRLCYANAGHPPAILAHCAGQDTFEDLNRTGLPLGIFPNATWGQGVVDLDHGDVLIAYTDGFTEACNAEGVCFEDAGLQASLKIRLKCSAQEIVDGVFADLLDFSGGMPQSDDLALVVVKRL